MLKPILTSALRRLVWLIGGNLLGILGMFVPLYLVRGQGGSLTAERLARAKDDALVMHPGPMNRGVEIDSSVADHPERSAITEQVEMGVAVRMACLDVLTRAERGVEGWA